MTFSQNSKPCRDFFAGFSIEPHILTPHILLSVPKVSFAPIAPSLCPLRNSPKGAKAEFHKTDNCICI